MTLIQDLQSCNKWNVLYLLPWCDLAWRKLIRAVRLETITLFFFIFIFISGATSAHSIWDINYAQTLTHQCHVREKNEKHWKFVSLKWDLTGPRCRVQRGRARGRTTERRECLMLTKFDCIHWWSQNWINFSKTDIWFLFNKIDEFYLSEVYLPVQEKIRDLSICLKILLGCLHLQ